MTEFNFFLNTSAKISIVIPHLPEKNNYYYEPTEKLHKFDEATVIYHENDLTIVLNKDILNEIIGVFNVTLKKLISGDLQLPSTTKVGSLGYILNNILNEKQEDDVSFFWIWARNNVQTLFYNVADKIHMEIVPLYPWTYLEPESGDDYISFDQFMKEYKPYVVHVIDRDRAIQWKQQCEAILNSINSDYLIQNT